MSGIRNDRLEVVAPAPRKVRGNEFLPLEVNSGSIARGRLPPCSRQIPCLRVALAISRRDRRVGGFSGRFE